MTKGGGLACGPRGPHRADCHLGIVDDDTRNASCHPVSALSTRQLVHSRWQALPTGCDALGQGCALAVRLGLGLALPPWRHAAMVPLRPRLSSARTRLAVAPLREVYSEPPRLVACAWCQDSPPRVPARVPGLGHPCPPLRPGPCRRAASRLPQDAAAGLPPQGVHSLGGRRARRAARAAGEPPCRRTASAAGSRGAGGQRATAARAPTLTTTDQAAESIRRGCRVSARPGPMTRQARRGHCDGRVAAAGWHRDGPPRRRGGRLLPRARAPRLPGSCAPPGRRGAAPATGGDSRVARRASQAPSRGAMPAWATPGRGPLGRAAARGHWLPAGRLAGGGLPGTHGRHHGRVDRGKAPTAGSPRTGRSAPRARGRAGPRQPRAAAERGWAAPAPALGQPGPRIRSHGRADVSQPVRRRRIPPGPRDTRAPTTAVGACGAAEPWRPLVACDASRGGNHPPCSGGQGDALPAASQPGTLAGGPAVALSTLEGRVGPLPRGRRRHVSPSTTAWLCTRLGLWWTRRGNPGVERDGPGPPPADALGQACGLRHCPSPSAEGTGRPKPTVVPRQAGPPWCGARARASASLPPAWLHRCPPEARAAGESQRHTSRGCSHHGRSSTDVLTARMRALRTSRKTPDLRCTVAERLLTQCVQGA